MDETTSTSGEQTGATPGQRIGSYRIVQAIGAGGMSSVYLAVHEESGHQVALKVLTRTLARNSVLLQRFLREARSAETLDHSNIVSIYDRGMDEGRHYLVLEHVPGGDLHEYVHRQGPLSAAEAISVVKDVAGGLKYAAGRGLIHRDIKPSNLLRSPTGLIKIIDLGLALQNQIEDERVTRDGTTVGTVDYMAPEQARDSRATSIQSDIYSLGCTFYYLLTGVAPFPGGDITDKLTRHARTPAPNVNDLRPDVPPALAAIVQRMMAKKPEDRFASYDDLLSALSGVSVNDRREAPPIALVPLEESEDGAVIALEPWGAEAGDAAQRKAPSKAAAGEAIFPLAELEELSDELPPARAPSRSISRSLAPASYLGRAAALDRDEGLLPLAAGPGFPPPRSKGSASAPAWIVSGALIGVAFVILVVGMIQFIGSTPDTSADDTAAADHPAVSSEEPAVAESTSAGTRLDPNERVASASRVPKAPLSQAGTQVRELPWVEPADADAAVAPVPPSSVHVDASELPAWARSAIPARIDGPFIVVRRISDSSEPAVVSSLHQALDGRMGGTVELADDGPHFVDDLRFSGESRLIRARPGYRPIIRVQRSSQEAVRDQPAVFMLDRKNLTLDGIDLVVSGQELAPRQTVLFSCPGGSLTLHNCTITVLDRSEAGFEVIRAGSPTARATHIRLEKTLIRGSFTAGIDVSGGSSEVVLNQSLLRGDSNPLIRVREADSTAERRFFLCDSVLAGCGPIVARARGPGGSATRSVFRSFGSAFGRLDSASAVETVISSDDSAAAAKQIDWVGDDNLYAGWKGFFASGADHRVTVPNLAAVRSTWRAADRRSVEISAPWPFVSDVSTISAIELVPYMPERESILRQVAQPRPNLFEKTARLHAWPVAPEPLPWATPSPTGRLMVPRPVKSTLVRTTSPLGEPGLIPQTTPAAPAPTAGPAASALELTFMTSAAPWHGDLGAFLRDRLTRGVKLARVRVIGSGSHRFTPIRLERGLHLEIRGEAATAAELASWSPQPQTTGQALIELEGGALVLANVILKHDASSRLEHLIHVESGHLVLSHCQMTAPPSTGDFSGDLIEFRAPTTQPLPSNLQRAIFMEPVDRPVCRIADSLLITSGTALQVELGRGLVALSECAIAAGDAAIALVPTKVAKARFIADLSMDHCTLTSERSIVRFGPWPPSAAGPDRPWLINSQGCAFLAMYDRKTRDTVLLRTDAEALARGAVSWQANDDAADVDWFVACGEGALPSSRSRDVRSQWVQFWGNAHMSGVTGPRGSASAPTVRLWEKLRPGHIEPYELILEPDYHPDRPALSVGADLSRQGITRQAARRARRRN